MAEFFDGWPVALVFWFLFVLAVLRGQLMYWLGRGAAKATLDRGEPSTSWWGRTQRWLTDGGADAGIAVIRRWGLIMVTLSYLTIGFQSVVQAAAGVLRIPTWKYLLAQLPGALAWAAIYTTFGLVTFTAIRAGVTRAPLLSGVITIAAAVLLYLLIRGRRASPER